ncbi:EMB2654, partial [Symbiodinium sp. KB8]
MEGVCLGKCLPGGARDRRPINRKYGAEADEEIDHLREQVRALTDANLALRREVASPDCLCAAMGCAGTDATAILRSSLMEATTCDAPGNGCAKEATDAYTACLALRSLQRQSAWQEAISLFAAIDRRSVEINEYVCTAAVTSCGKGLQWALAEQILSSLPQRRLVPDGVLHSAVMAAGAPWPRAARLLQATQTAQVQSDVVTWSAAIASAEKGSWTTSLRYLSAMEAKGVQPNVVSFGACISAFREEMGVWQQAIALLEATPAVNEISVNAAIAACARSGEWVAALCLLNSLSDCFLRADAVSFSSAVSACENCSRWQEALAVLKRMQSLRHREDAFTCGAAMSACEKAGKWEEALFLIAAMCLHRLEVDTVCAGAALSACEKGQQRSAALRLFRSLRMSGCQLDAIAFHATISACEKAADWLWALELLSERDRCNLREETRRDAKRRGPVGLSAAVSACEKSREWRAALRLLASAEYRKADLDSIACNAAISACEKSVEWRWAVSLLGAMQVSSIRRDEVSYNAAISACENSSHWRCALALGPGTQEGLGALLAACEKAYEWRRALSVLTVHHLERLATDIISCDSMLMACRPGWHWQVALVLLGSMASDSMHPTALSYDAALPAFHAGGGGTSLSCFELQPKLNVGIKGKGITAMAGVRDIRDGLILDGMAMVTKHYMGQGRTIAEVLRNVKAQNPLPVIDDIVAAIPHVAAEIVHLIGADVTSDIVESVRGTLYAYTGVGVSAGVFLGWLDTDGYAMMGALGQASLLKSVALSFRVGISEDKMSSRLVMVVGNVGFEELVSKLLFDYAGDGLFLGFRRFSDVLPGPLLIHDGMETYSSFVQHMFSFGAALSACERGSQWLLALLLLQDMDVRSVQRDVI